MRSFVPLTFYCISLVSLHQLLALPSNRNSLDVADRQEEGISAHQTDGLASVGHIPKWLPGFLGMKTKLARLAWDELAATSPNEARSIRARRHAHSRGRHHYPQNAQVMRVGCVLGTCQVQNLSHRLYQLIGQKGREDSSPINPKSPHSYG